MGGRDYGVLGTELGAWTEDSVLTFRAGGQGPPGGDSQAVQASVPYCPKYCG